MNEQVIDSSERTELNSLPPAAKRWLARSLPDAPLAPAQEFRVEQEGAIEIRGRWTVFESTGLYSANPLTFDWRARLKMLPGVWIVAEDGHRQGIGWGGARLWGVVSMGKRSDPEVLKSQLVRNVAELALLPALALAETTLEWSDSGTNGFEIAYQNGGQESLVRFELNEQGDIIQACSPARPYDLPDGYAEAPWRYDFGDHRDYEGVRLPATALATFEKPDGPWEYLKVNTTSVKRMT